MKEHRWIMDIRCPCKVIVNEDKVILTTIEDKPLVDRPSLIWCYDCEKKVTDCFGGPCEAEKDLTASDALWEGLQ